MMRTAKQIFEEELSGEPLTQESVIEAIKIVQLEAIEEVCKVCAKNAKMIGYYSEPSSVESVRTKTFKRLWQNKATGFKVDVKLNICKDSILNCSEILKKEIE